MVIARPGGSDGQQPPASFPSSLLGATSLRVPERITACDAESARTARHRPHPRNHTT